MKHRHFFIPSLLLASCVTTASAAPRTLNEAKNIAQAFFADQYHVAASDIALEQVSASAIQKISANRNAASTTANEENSYYIFNNKSTGFVIVSGSDLLRPVLAYADKQFSTDEMPDNIVSWLEFVNEATAYVEKNNQAAITAEEYASLDMKPISHLLEGIMWGQDEPYNRLCPSQYPVGCLATAMVQIMYYHRYPEHGYGSNSYIWNNKTLSRDFSQQTYNWDVMFDKYNPSTSSEEGCAEVAKLSYDCGIALNMDYALAGSGAYISSAEFAARNYFGYNPYTSVQNRDYYSFDDWNKLLYNELANKRPILFTGYSSSGGHAFVVDGYDEQGYYHINWGWDGYYDGYYDICILNPDGTGTGASESSNGFSTSQSALIQLMPTTEKTGKYMCSLFGTNISCSTTSTTLGGSAYIRVPAIYNYGSGYATGACGIAFVQDSNIVASTQIGILNIGTLYSTSINSSITIPKNLTDGTYKAYIYFAANNESDTCLIHTSASTRDYLTMTVSGNNVTFAPTSSNTSLSAANWSFDQTKYYQGRKSTITVDITNNDTTTTFVGYITVRATPSLGWAEDIVSDNLAHIKPGETATVSFTKIFTTAGTWKAKLYYALQNVTTTLTSLGAATKEFTIEADASANANLYLNSTPWLANDTVYADGEATFAIDIKNLANADYEGQFQIQIFKNNTTSTPILTLTSDGSTTANAASDTVFVTGILDGLTGPKIYYGKAHYLSAGEYKAVSSELNVSQKFSFRVYAKTANGIEDIANDSSTKTVKVYNLLGKSVGATTIVNDEIKLENLPAGIYIVNNKKVIVK